MRLNCKHGYIAQQCVLAIAIISPTKYMPFFSVTSVLKHLLSPCCHTHRLIWGFGQFLLWKLRFHQFSTRHAFQLLLFWNIWCDLSLSHRLIWGFGQLPQWTLHLRLLSIYPCILISHFGPKAFAVPLLSYLQINFRFGATLMPNSTFAPVVHSPFLLAASVVKWLHGHRKPSYYY